MIVSYEKHDLSMLKNVSTKFLCIHLSKTFVFIQSRSSCILVSRFILARELQHRSLQKETLPF